MRGFDKTFDLTAGVYFNFYDILPGTTQDRNVRCIVLCPVASPLVTFRAVTSEKQK